MSKAVPSTRKPFVVVLTGGIASGKTTVSDLFTRLGAPVIDTDLIAREVVEPDQPALTAIAREFGHDILLEDGTLDRARLRKKIFADADSRQWLQDLLHPLIRKIVSTRIEAVDAPYCILVVPLFAETSGYRWVDRVLLVDVPEAVQVERLVRRDGVTPEQARQSLSAQASRESRRALADDVISNEVSSGQLSEKVEELHQLYQNLATHEGGPPKSE